MKVLYLILLVLCVACGSAPILDESQVYVNRVAKISTDGKVEEWLVNGNMKVVTLVPFVVEEGTYLVVVHVVDTAHHVDQYEAVRTIYITDTQLFER